MTDYIMYIIIAIVVVIALWFLFAKILKNRRPKEVSMKDIPVDIDALLNALGGIDNIKESIANGSKITFFVNKDDVIKVNTLKQLGASGIIQSTGKITVIMGKFSEEICRVINNYK